MPGQLNILDAVLAEEREGRPPPRGLGPGAAAAVSGENRMMLSVSALAIWMLHFYFWQVMMVCLIWRAFIT